MSEKIDTRYILQHKSHGLYVSRPGHFCENISDAKLWEPNNKRDEEIWRELSNSDDYKIIMRTETHTVRYEEAEF